ncbi:MAG TPA: DUF883 C-terminal domain-containing protein [Burkholderiales bacterium]|nr:DUF883 C-terminal domain-containing protein [Burkholderiales bacterium]
MASEPSSTRNPQQTVDRLSQSAHQAVDRAASAASSYAERFGERGEELMQMPQDWLDTARDYVRENPMQAVGMALAAGYLLSILMRSRD